MIRAIGKGSLASILAICLHIVRVVVWIGFAGLSAAIVAIPIIPSVADFISHIDGASIDGDIDVDAADFVEVLRYFISFGVALYVVERLLDLLKTLRFGSPFVKENAKRTALSTASTPSAEPDTKSGGTTPGPKPVV